MIEISSRFESKVNINILKTKRDEKMILIFSIKNQTNSYQDKEVKAFSGGTCRRALHPTSALYASKVRLDYHHLREESYSLWS